MPRGLIDHDSFLKLDPAAQENLLRQSLLLWLTALDLAGRDPDAWEAEAFTAAMELLAMQAPRTAYRDVERMLLPPGERPSSEQPCSDGRDGPALTVPQSTAILRIDISEATPSSPRETPDRVLLRRRLLQLSTLQPPPERAEAAAGMLVSGQRKVAALAEAEDTGD